MNNKNIIINNENVYIAPKIIKLNHLRLFITLSIKYTLPPPPNSKAICSKES